MPFAQEVGGEAPATTCSNGPMPIVVVVDGLSGFPQAIAVVFPQTTVQTPIVHPIRNSLAFVSWKDRKTVMPDLRAVYRSETAKLDAFEAAWGERYPAIVPA